MTLPKQIHLVLDNNRYRLSVLTPDNRTVGWKPSNSDQVNESSLVPPELVPELLHNLLFRSTDESIPNTDN